MLFTILLSHSCSISIRLLFLLLVELVHPLDQKAVAVGTVIQREQVHGRSLEEELPISAGVCCIGS